MPNPKVNSHLSTMDTVGYIFLPETFLVGFQNVTDLVFSHHIDAKKGKSIKSSKIWEEEPCAGERFLKKKCVHI